MKLKTLLILLFLATTGYSLTFFPEGSCNNFLCYMPRDPFYNFSNGGEFCSINIKLDYPEDNSTFYSNTLTINTTVSGGVGTVSCWYTENGAGNLSTNEFDCVNQTITFPSGNVTLIVYAQDSLSCTASDTAEFEVTLFEVKPGGVYVLVWPLYAFLGFILLFGGSGEVGKMGRKHPSQRESKSHGNAR